MPTIPPNAVHLPFLREAPHLLHLVSDLRTTHIAHAVAQVSISSISTRYVSDSGCALGRSVGTYPVAKTTTSASSSVPSANLSPFSVKRSMALPFLSLISPLMTCLLVPVSIERCRDVVSSITFERLANVIASRMREQKLEDACCV